MWNVEIIRCFEDVGYDLIGYLLIALYNQIANLNLAGVNVPKDYHHHLLVNIRMTKHNCLYSIFIPVFV